MRAEELARALATVPEKHLRLVELAWQCAPGGKLDLERCAALQAEIAAALQEAEEYAIQTRRVTWALEKLLAP